jgi:hypothetical protein
MDYQQIKAKKRVKVQQQREKNYSYSYNKYRNDISKILKNIIYIYIYKTWGHYKLKSSTSRYNNHNFQARFSPRSGSRVLTRLPGSILYIYKTRGLYKLKSSTSRYNMQ